MHYLDSASTSKVDKEVITEMLPFFDVLFHNGSSNHKGGKIVQQFIEEARLRCADLINSRKVS